LEDDISGRICHSVEGLKLLAGGFQMFLLGPGLFQTQFGRSLYQALPSEDFAHPQGKTPLGLGAFLCKSLSK
jgi:hypothetical protein